jgi:protoporphyrinogen oxidase
LATSHVDEDGFSYDTGAHFITNRLAREIGVLDRCRTVRHYGEHVWLGGRSYGYPFGLMRVPRFVSSAISGKAAAVRSKPPVDTAQAWFRAEYGHRLADEVALPLIEEWSGAPADQLSAAVGDKLPSSIAETIMLRIAARATRRAVAVGYCREMPQSPKVWHVYPDTGVSLLCEKLADELGDVVKLESPVERIIVDDGVARAIRVGGTEIAASAVISTAPVHVLPKLVEGTDALERFAPFRYRPMLFVNLRLRGRGLLPDVVTWTPESHFRFFRLTEPPMSMPWLAPDGMTTIMADIGAEVGDEHWTMDEGELAELCLSELEAIVPDVRRRYAGFRVVRTPIAYPVFRMDYEADRQALETSTGVDRLLSIGRNGEFAHILMEDVYWRTHARIEHLAADLATARSS